MTNTHRVVTIAATAALMFGCSDAAPIAGPGSLKLSVGLPIITGSLTGTWSRTNEVPGSSEVWSIVVTDGAVTGSGQWTGEACCSGTIGVRGHIEGDSVQLDLSFFNGTGAADSEPRFVQHVAAVLSATDVLAGIASVNGGTRTPAKWTRTTAPAGPFDGTWTRLGEIPGSSEQWTIAVTGSAVTGTGTWTGEACCAGTITVRGVVLDGRIHLDLSFFNSTRSPADTLPRFVAHADAALATPNDLVGTLSTNGVPAASARWARGTARR